MKQERFALGVVVVMLAIVIASVSVAWIMDGHYEPNTAQLHAALPENGGWSNDILYAQVGKPLYLQLISDDVIHGFAVGREEGPDIELYPGIPNYTTLTFDQPGTYTFYCTRWCGPNHWRMRGTIEVAGEGELSASGTPRYVRYNIDIDTPHPADSIPAEIPKPLKGERWASLLPAYVLEPDTYWSHSPAQLWVRLRAESALSALSDREVWDCIAWIWSRQGTQVAFAQGKTIFAQECAACHGETGKGDGVMVRDLMPFSYAHGDFGHSLMRPPDFSDPAHMLGAAPALVEGKLLRGGMGTGMPLYGSIYTESDLEALVNYLYTFIFQGDSQSESDH